MTAFWKKGNIIQDNEIKYQQAFFINLINMFWLKEITEKNKKTHVLVFWKIFEFFTFYKALIYK